MGAEASKAPSHVSHTPATCSFSGSTTRSYEFLCNAHKGQGKISALTLEFLSSEQIWRDSVVEANLFFPNTRLQTHASWLPPSRGRLAFPTSCELLFPPAGKSLPGGLFSEAVTPEPRAEVGTHTHRVKQIFTSLCS